MRISIVSGSSREGRRSHRVALGLGNQIEAVDHKSVIIDLMQLELPPFVERFGNVDDPNGKLAKISEIMKVSDGLIFLTPEYNGAMSSGLKNFIDVFAKASFDGKPIGVATASAGPLGGIRAAYQLQQTILCILAYPMPQMLTVGNVTDVLDEDGTVIDDEFRRKIEQYTDTYLGFVRKFKV